MAVKAANEVTITDETDIDKLVMWYQLTSSATAPSAPTTTQTSASVSGWTQAEPSFDPAQGTKYLYTVIQTQWKDGSCTWGSAQLSSSYEQAKQAWNKANAAKDAVDNIEVGARNLLCDTNSSTLTKITGPGNRYFSDNSTYRTASIVAIPDPPVPAIEYGGRISTTGTSHTTGDKKAALCSYSGVNVPMIEGEKYTFSFWARKVSGTCAYYCQVGSSPYLQKNGSNNYKDENALGTNWERIVYTFTYTSATCGGVNGCRVYPGIVFKAQTEGVGEVCGMKLERGTVATEWTLAQEDTEYAVYQSSLPNLTPWFEIKWGDTSYWKTLASSAKTWSNTEGLHSYSDGENGWAHFTLDSRESAGNNGSSSNYMNMWVDAGKIQQAVKPGGTYTWMIEVKNLTWTGATSSDKLHIRPSVNNGTQDVFGDCNMTFDADGVQYGIVTARSDFSSLTQDTRGYCYIPTGCYADFDLRISLYEGNYSGPWKPYSGSLLYSTRGPIDTRTYTGLYGSSNDAAGASFYFAKVHPSAYTAPWRVKLHIYVSAPVAYTQIVDIEIRGDNSNYRSYDAFVSKDANLAMYYFNLYRATQAGITAGKGHALGFGLRSSTNPTNSSYPRTIKVDVLDVENCSVELLDTAVKYASMDGTGSTNYAGLNELNISGNGQYATNNGNTTYSKLHSGPLAGKNGLKRYTLCMKDDVGNWTSITTTANSTGTSHGAYTGGMMLGNVAYYSHGSEISAGSNGNDGLWESYTLDLRYSTNCGSTLTNKKATYLVGTVVDGLFYLDTTTWWTQTPNSTSKVYVLLGYAYSTYQIFLNVNNPTFTYDGTNLVPHDAYLASKTATNYIVDYGSGTTAGIWITPEDRKANADGSPNANTRGWRIGDALEMFRGTASMLKAWLDDTVSPAVAKVRVGLENAGHSIFSTDGMEVFTDATTSVAKFGEVSRIGQDDTSHIEMDFLGISELDENDSVFFMAKDLRNEMDPGYGYYGYFVENFTATANQLTYDLMLAVYGGVELLWVDETEVPLAGEYQGFWSNISYSNNLKRVTFPDGYLTINDGSKVKILYSTNDPNMKGFYFGKNSSMIAKLGPLSAAFGENSEAKGYAAFSHGSQASASGNYSHAEGSSTTASGMYSHAEGNDSEASGLYSHAEGGGCIAGGKASHAEGGGTTASGPFSHAEGSLTIASGNYSHAQNVGTIAASASQTVIGRFNEEDSLNKYALIIGNGPTPQIRGNALTVTWNGAVAMRGDVDWTTLQLNSATLSYNDSSAPKYRRWGPVVNFIGAVKPASQVAAGGTLNIGTLPSGCRPKDEVHQLCQGSGQNKWLLDIGTDGAVTATRYSTGGTQAAIPTNAWLVFNTTFMVP